MIIEIKKSVPKGVLNAPPSKSFSHRSLILGAFSKNSVIKNIAFSDDIKATLSCLQTLGAKVKKGENDVFLGGLNIKSVKDGVILNCFESGSTLRFLIPVCLLTGKRITFCGTERLLSRPLDEYERICLENGFLFEKSKKSLTVCGRLNPGGYTLKSDTSSQFVTGMMLALSLMDAKSNIALSGEIESRPYIDITAKCLRDFGINAEFSDGTITVLGKGIPESAEYTVEADASNAAYLEAFSFLGDVSVSGVDSGTVQGDIIYKDYFSGLRDGKREFDLKDCPDLAPVMFAASCLFGGARFYGTKRLALKESDRVFAMEKELNKFGVRFYKDEDSVRIFAENLNPPSEPLSGHNDHRIVMALSLLCAKFAGIITGAEAVNKSFPDFFEKISEIGIGVNKNAG